MLEILNIRGMKVAVHGEIYDGKPVVFAVHGAGGGAWLWEKTRFALRGSASLLAIDLPGHGISAEEGFSSISDYVAIVRESAKALDIDRPVAMGHSMGGAIALEWAINHGNELKGVIAVSTGAKLRVMDAVFKSIQADYNAYVSGLASMAFGENPDAKIVELLKRETNSVKPQVTYGDFLACDTFDAMTTVGSIGIPTIALCGEADKMTPLKYSQYLVYNVPNSQLKSYPKAGHMLPLERPIEIAAAISEMLDSAK